MTNWDLKDLRIVRQSTIKSACDFLKGTDATDKRILELAHLFEQYVYRKEVPTDFESTGTDDEKKPALPF